MKRVELPSYTVAIFVGGDTWEAEQCCRIFCDEVGLCVTIEPVRYVYTGGAEAGVRVGLINYGRFPSDPDSIFARAEILGERLMGWCGQKSASIVATDRTIWLSRRNEDPSPPTDGPKGQDGMEGSGS